MTPYFTSWSEHRVLEYFWSALHDPDTDRIELLRQIAGVAVKQPTDINAWKVRQRSLELRREAHVKATRCFCCRSEDRSIIWHHIVLVKHGGSERLSNQVPLCDPCHALVHPWLKAERRPAGFQSIQTIMADFMNKWADALDDREHGTEGL